MNATVCFTANQNFSSRFPSFKEKVSAWTNQIIKSVVKANNIVEVSAEIHARAKIMSLMTATLRQDDGIQNVSARFNEGMWHEVEASVSLFNTAQSVRSINSNEIAEVTRESLISLLLNSDASPEHYEMEDSSLVIDFTNSPSRLTCVFDDYGLQIMWRTSEGVHSEVIRKDFIHLNQIMQKISVILQGTALLH